MNARPQHFEDFLTGPISEDIMTKTERLGRFLDTVRPSYVDGLGLEILDGARNRVRVRGEDEAEHEVITLGSNSYLSLTVHPRVQAAVADALERYGCGTGAVALYAGTNDLHRELERLMAEVYDAEDAVLFPCGYSGNVGVVSAMVGAGDVVLNDAANHASIFDGAVLSGADVKVYLHANMRHLEKQLRRLPDDCRGRLIVTDGVFSMDGDAAPLQDILALARTYNARVMVDDAHGLGVMGATGKGTPEHCGCNGDIDIMYGTLSKGPGMIGGYCAGSRELVRYLRYYARTYFFSTSIPAPVVAGLVEIFKMLLQGTAGHRELWDNINYLKPRIDALGFDTGSSCSAIIPIIVGDEELMGDLCNGLRAEGVLTNVVTYPAVRRKECRLRLSVNRLLTREDMDHALAALARVGRRLRIIPAAAPAGHIA